MHLKLPILLFISLYAFSAFGVRKCYRCNDVDQCKNPAKVTCKDGVTGCLTATQYSGDFYGKDCSEDFNGNPLNIDGCINQTIAGFDLYICGCTDKDYCNDQEFKPLTLDEINEDSKQIKRSLSMSDLKLAAKDWIGN